VNIIKNMKRLSLIAWYNTRIKNIPNWMRFNIGLLSVITGFLILTRPFNSLQLLIILVAAAVFIEGLQRFINNLNQSDKFLGIIYIVAALLIALWPGISIGIFAFIVGVILIINGIEGVIVFLLKKRNNRAYTLLVSLSYIILGYLALTWPDISSIVIALVFGIKLLWFGLSLLFRVTQEELLVNSKIKMKKNKNKSNGRFIHLAGATLLLLVSIGLIFLSNQIQSKNATVESFYEVSSEIPKLPGKIIKIEEFTKAVPADARGWRIIYTTTSDNNTPAISSAFVMTAKEPKLTPQPVIAWTHGTTGYAQQCAPTNLPEPFPLDAVTPDLPAAIDAGYIIVGTDYMGLGTEGPHPYLIGEPVARASLDSIRALKEIPELIVDNKNFVWGHSQGGGTALWTGQISEDYAPELNVLGVIAAAPASDVPALLDRSKDSPVGKILGAFTVTAYSNIYPDVSFDEYVKPTVQPIVKEMAKRCFSESETLVSILTSLIIKGPIYDRDPLSGPFGERLNQNIPTETIDIPVFIAQGASDVLVYPDIQETYVDMRCQNGQKLEYRKYEGLDHVGVVGEGSAFREDALTWTNERLTGKPFEDSCSKF
jgi:uncharacterized membrane protein HdeD (DUF308 family)/alpha-beta hydrolase superfamily lysophospholipase